MASKTNYLFSKLKPKFPKRQDGDGHEIQVEVREDEEQSVKLQEIIDLLVAAGYFRARIKGLSSFDKVVGGMTWCIESCNVEVDVDILFQENSTIGQKIALTEKIVAVLPKLECPHQIEPHQIQGLDFIHIFPVIQWLVKRSLEFRTDTADFVQTYAVNQFDKVFPQPQEFSDKERQLLTNIKNVNEIYKPHRIFRRKYALPNKDIGSKVQITLLEYGYKNITKQKNDNVTNSEECGEIQELNEHQIQQIMNNMTVTDEELFDYENLDEADQDKLLKHYKNLNKELKISNSLSNEEQQLDDLKTRTEELNARVIKLEGQKSEVEMEIEELNKILKDVKLKQSKIDENLKEIESQLVNPEKAEEVASLLKQSDNLKKREIEFKDQCKKELRRIQDAIENAKKSQSQSVESKEGEIDKQLEEQSEKLKVLRLQVAKKSRAISVLQRKIDDVPSRAELAQYQKRFIELYNQISAKHKETKQYYSLYNTLEDTRLYMKKELSLLNSVCDSYPEAMLSKEGKEEFLQQFTNIFEGVTQSKSKLDKRFAQEKKRRDELSKALQTLTDINRKYVAAIKQLKLECQKNEILIAKINS